MSRIPKWKNEKTKVKVVFRLQFHATHVRFAFCAMPFNCFYFRPLEYELGARIESRTTLLVCYTPWGGSVNCAFLAFFHFLVFTFELTTGFHVVFLLFDSLLVAVAAVGYEKDEQM